MELFRDLLKMAKQAVGLENMFGYRTTLANQLYLMYVLLGKMYWTDKLRWPVKFVYFLPNLTQLCLGVCLCVICSIHGFNNDFNLFTQMAFLTMLNVYLIFVLPWACWTFDGSIETMIKRVDAMLVRGRRSVSSVGLPKDLINIKTSLMADFALFCGPLMVYMCAGTCDVVLFYEEEKVKNYIYYMIPLPNIRQYGSIGFLIFVNVGVAFFVGFIAFLQLWSITAMPFVWSAVCHNEVVHICQDLRVASRVRSADGRLIVTRTARAYQEVGCIIRSFKGFYNMLCTITLVQLLAIAIANTYMVLLWDYPYLVRIRGISAVMVCLLMILQLCSVGGMIDNLTNLMSSEVYSTPWYWSTKNRRDVQLFLCQAQTVFDLSAFKVYPFVLSTVLRFINVVYSSANFLRKVTRK